MNQSSIQSRLILVAFVALSAGFAMAPATSVAEPFTGILQGLASAAKQQDGAFVAFSSDRGRELFLAVPAQGKPDTPSCTSCHGKSPTESGMTRAGKEIAPMARSKSSTRYMDPKKVEKWFRRNCKSVLGRVCSPREKGDFLTYMATQ